jgi:hypothetical protein
MIQDLHEMCETIGMAIHEANNKIKKAGGELSAGDICYIDQLTHALKSIKATIAMEEGDYANDGGASSRGSYEGASSRRGSYADGASSRGRSMMTGSREGGHYSGRGYSRTGNMEGMLEELRNMADEVPDERTRRELHAFAEKLEQMA